MMNMIFNENNEGFIWVGGADPNKPLHHRSNPFLLNPVNPVNPVKNSLSENLRPSADQSPPVKRRAGADHSLPHESVIVEQDAVFVFGIGDEAAAFGIDHPVHCFQRNLADDVRQIVRELDDVEPAGAPLNFQFHDRKDAAGFPAIGHGMRCSPANLPQAELSDDRGFQIQPRGAGIHQRLGFNTAGRFTTFAGRQQRDVAPVLKFDVSDDFAHAKTLTVPPASVKGPRGSEEGIF